MLWAQRLDDAIPADHPVRLFDELLHSAAFAPTFAALAQKYVLREGQPPYHPRDLAGLYLYGMLNRIRSSRQLQAACWNRLDVIWLLQGHKPEHATIAAFVTRPGATLRHEGHRERLRARMNTAEGRAVYKRRRETVEPRLGWIKHGLGVRRFLRRGLEKVRTEWALVAATVNVSILLGHWDAVRPVL